MPRDATPTPGREGARRAAGDPRPDRVYLGWEYALVHPDPGPQPRRPTPPDYERLNPAWLQAQRREENQLHLPLKLIAGTTGGLVVLVAVLGALGFVDPVVTAIAAGLCLLLTGFAVYGIWQGERALDIRVGDERTRLERLRADRDRQLFAAQEEHARHVQAWRERRIAYETQLQWYAVSLPREVDRVDVVGGTAAGWSALVATLGATRMDAGAELTVVDLSEGAVAGELVELARDSGREAVVWSLPDDLPRLDLGAGLSAEAFCDVLSLVVRVMEEQTSTRDLALDNAILSRVLETFDGHASVAQVTAALRTIAQVGDPRDDVRRGLLTSRQVDMLRRTFGRTAVERVALERAWTLEAELRRLDALGAAAVPAPAAQLRVVSMGRRGDVLGNRVLGTYVTTALTHELRGAAPRDPWQHTLVVCGAERLRGDVLDRLCDACEATGTGLVTMYRSIPRQLKERLGRGNAAVAFMRLGNAEDAKAASEHVGTEHRFVLSQLTETVGSSVTDTTGDSYTRTHGTNDSVAASTSTTRSRGGSRDRGRTDKTPWAALGDSSWTRSHDRNWSRASSEGETLTEGVSTSSSWGRTTSRATATNESLARTMQRSREFLVEQHELQRLPGSAFILSRNAAEHRRVVLADANPAILSLPRVTIRGLDEVRADEVPRPVDPAPAAIHPWDPAKVPPNLGPPSERLDWRR
ncbi:MAG: hypothetical protein ACRDN9_09650 [Streptosporangiaceae bacterium]